MKKAGLFLAGTMTCAILFGILWGTGWVKFTWPVPQGNTTAADNKVAPLMILGKWEGIRKDAPFGAEFMDKGLVIFSHAGNSTDNDKALSAMIAGKYKCRSRFKRGPVSRVEWRPAGVAGRGGGHGQRA